MSDSPLAPALTPAQLLTHWQGHRALTRRVISAFPDDQLYTFAVGGMRPFGVLANEMLGMAVPMVKGAITGEWAAYAEDAASTKADVLRLWDATTAELDALWPQLSADKFQVTMTAFGQYTDLLCNLLLYAIDNEIHHRGQGYVYLRALGIEPPAFWER